MFSFSALFGLRGAIMQCTRQRYYAVKVNMLN